MSPDAYIDMAQAQANHWWFAARRDILRRQIRRLSLPAGTTILEVGSGTGANLELLAEFGETVGLEMEPDAIALAARSGVRHIVIRQGRCPEDLDQLGQLFDLICLFDVLEHIEHDTHSLERLRQLLNPGGRLLLTVPAYPWMWGPHDQHLHHQRRYTQSSLRAVCEQAGLSVVYISHFNTLLFPLALIGRLIEKATGRVSGATRTPAAPVNALLRRIFAMEQYILPSLPAPFGLSLLAIARPAAS